MHRNQRSGLSALFRRTAIRFPPTALRPRVPLLGAAAILVLSSVLLGAPRAAVAQFEEPETKCRSLVVREAGAYAKLALEAVRSCAIKRANGAISGGSDCTQPQLAASANGSPLPSSVFEDDPALGACQGIAPAAVLYTSCPAPCDGIPVTDWTGVGDCMQCVLESEVADYADDVVGSVAVPAAPAERTCVKALAGAGQRVATAVLRGNERCQRHGGNHYSCEEIDGASRAKLRKARAKASTSIASACAVASLASIGACATSVSDAGCVVARAERHARDLVHAISRLLAAGPTSPPTTYIDVHVDGGRICALRSDGSATCFGDGGRTPPGRFAALSGSCWLRDDGSADCHGSLPAAGAFTKLETYDDYGNSTCGLRSDGTIACWPYQTQDYPGTWADFAGDEYEFCVIDAGGALHCWTRTGYYNNTPFEYDRPGTFTALSVTSRVSCAVRSDGTLDCWMHTGTAVTAAEMLPPPGTFVDVSMDWESACAIRTDQTVVCWGIPDLANSTPPGIFTKVAVSSSAACGIRTDGSLDCWGGDFSRVTDEPGASFSTVSSNGRCGIQGDGSIRCWGNDLEGAAAAPAGTFVDIAAGGHFSCAIASDQSLSCWGNMHHSIELPPSGSFDDLQVARGGCALRGDQTVACWGDDYYYPVNAPSGTFTRLGEGANGSHCGIRSDGSLSCWHTSIAISLPGTFLRVTAGSYHGCGLRSSGLVDCWASYPYSNTDFGQHLPPPGTFKDIAAGSLFTCGIASDDTIDCWGIDSSGESSPPAGTFTQLAIGALHACALRTDGTAACWGHDIFGDTQAPSGTFTKLSAGTNHTCGLRGDGSIECWGSDDYGVAAPPPGNYVALDANNRIGCGVRDDGGIQCWGREYPYFNVQVLDAPTSGVFESISLSTETGCGIRDDGSILCWGTTMASPPAGMFTQVSTSGSGHTCALRDTGAVVCWGSDEVGQGLAPFDAFVQISAKGRFPCGVRTDGTLACWGGSYGHTQPPAGKFTEVATGDGSACALRTDGSAACWGVDDWAVSTPPAETFEHVFIGTRDDYPSSYYYSSPGYACGQRADGTVRCWGQFLR